MQYTSSVLIWAFLVLVVSKMGEACSCLPQHYQTLFCRADAVIHGTVKSVEFIYADNAITDNEIYGSSVGPSYLDPLPVRFPRYPLFVVYNVTIHEVFKGEEELVGMTTISASSAGTGAMCGIADLQEGENYVMTGFLWDGELNIGLCSSWVEPMNSLTSFQKRGLKRLYAKTCDDCRICSPMYDNDCQKSYGCMATPTSTCINKNSACTRSSKGKCTWKKSKYIKLC